MVRPMRDRVASLKRYGDKCEFNSFILMIAYYYLLLVIVEIIVPRIIYWFKSFTLDNLYILLSKDIHICANYLSLLSQHSCKLYV